MNKLFYKWFNDNKRNLQEKGIRTDFISEPTSTNNPSIFADHITDKYMGRVTVWESGSINVEIIDQNSGETVFNKHQEIM